MAIGTRSVGNTIATDTTDTDHEPLGNPDRVTDAKARVTDYVIDALGRDHWVTNALSNDKSYSFDGQDALTLFTAPNGGRRLLNELKQTR